ncbi:MAG: endonuclease/exonuclease/phosphatase family protein [Clostridia bacterium]|nr:endonuclease/exonuclease/phosphatase family protein [Clostridia bacterium]
MKEMKARLVSLNILTHELFGRNYRLYGDQTPDDYTFEKRMWRFISLLEYTKADVVMLQELSGPKYWGTALELEAADETKSVYTSKHFPGYAWVNSGNRYGVPYADNQTKRNPFDAHNMTMYRTDKYDMLANGTFWLTEDGTRETSWYENGSARIHIYDDIGDCTWMVLADKETGIKAIYATTHSYVGSLQRNAYHVENLQIMTTNLGKLAEQYGDNGKALPIIVAGDFNISPHRRNVGHSYEHMVKYAKYDDAKMVAPITDGTGTARVYGGDMAGHDGTTWNGERIDFFFSQGMDIDKYSVLSGMFKPVDEVRYEYVHEGEGLFDGSMYDLSDHQPIYCEITVGEGDKYTSHRETEFYRNPNTAKDTVLTDEPEITWDDRCITIQSRRQLPFIGGYYSKMKDELVGDSEKGRVLRIMANKATNIVDEHIRLSGLRGRYAPEGLENPFSEGASKVKITYKTQYSVDGAQLWFRVICGDMNSSAAVRSALIPATNGEWSTVEIDVSGAGAISELVLFGDSHNTGLMVGDAVYVASIEIE